MKSNKNISLIEQLHTIAANHKGACLTTETLSADSRVLLNCEKGHQWHASASAVMTGSWCPSCCSEAVRHNHA